MRVQVDTEQVRDLAAGLRAEADAARRLASDARRLGGDLSPGGVTGGLQALGQVCADVLGAVAIDLDRLAAATHAGAAGYDDVEAAVAGAAAAGRP